MDQCSALYYCCSAAAEGFALTFFKFSMKKMLLLLLPPGIIIAVVLLLRYTGYGGLISCFALILTAGCVRFTLSTVNNLAYSIRKAYRFHEWYKIFGSSYIIYMLMHYSTPLPHSSGTAWYVSRRVQNSFLRHPLVLIQRLLRKKIPGSI